jgi:purine-binding chemotaxis protein CheW
MKNLPEDNLLEVTEFEIIRTNSERFVVFYLDEETFAVPSKCVAEVDRVFAVTPVPNVPDWFLGISNLRGDLISVVDLRTFWNRQTTPPQKAKTIILRSNKDGFEIAFVVDKIGEIAILDTADIEGMTNSEKDLPLLHVHEKAKYKESSFYLLDAEKLLASPKLLRLQA